MQALFKKKKSKKDFIKNKRGAWVSQSVKHPTLDFCSGHGLTVGEIEPHIGLLSTAWSLLGILSLPFSLPLPCSHSLNK